MVIVCVFVRWLIMSLRRTRAEGGHGRLGGLWWLSDFDWMLVCVCAVIVFLSLCLCLSLSLSLDLPLTWFTH